MNKYLLWFLLLVAIVILTHGVRERLEPTGNIKAPPYSNDERDRIQRMLTSSMQTAIERHVRRGYELRGINDANLINQKVREAPSEYVANFYNQVYKPATTPITESAIDPWVTRGFAALEPRETNEIRSAIRSLIKAYFMDQPSSPPQTTGSTAAGAGRGTTTTTTATTSTPAAGAGSTSSTPAPVDRNFSITGPATVILDIKA